MAYRTRARARSNTNVSDTSVRDEQEANPFATTAASFLPFSESISAIGTGRRRSTAYGPSAPSAATAALSAIGEITSPDLAVETLYTKDGVPVEVWTPRGGRRIRRTSPQPSSPSPTTATQAAKGKGRAISPLFENLSHSQNNPTQVPEPAEQVQDEEPDVTADEDQPEDPTPQGPGGGPGGPDGPDGPGGSGGPGGPGGPGNSGNSGDDEIPIPDSSQFMNIMSNFSSNINNLGTVLSGMKSTDDAGNKTKPKEAEVFDGSDPRKLRSFLVSLALVFNDRPKYFTETKKINYTLSYLSGTARQWFEPDILDPDLLNMPEWTYSFSALVRELQKQFGVYDMQSEAEGKIGNIVMKDSDTIRKYNNTFNSLASLTGWDENALRWAYEKGVAPRLKDEMARVRKPKTLEEYREIVLEIDNRYWQRELEKKRESAKSSGGNSSSGNSSAKKGSSNPSPTNNNISTPSFNKPNSNGSKFNQKNKSGGADQRKSTDSSKFGPDGKVTPEEKERRKKYNLCAFCGGKHKFEDCNKRKARDAKGRATEVVAMDPTDQPSEDAKK